LRTTLLQIAFLCGCNVTPASAAARPGR
jgi:hypothetical protein